MLNISLQVLHTPPKKPDIDTQPVSIEDKVRDMIDHVETGYNSKQEWYTLYKLFRGLLNSPKKGPRVQNLINMIRPVMAKYGYHETPGSDGMK